MAEEKKKPKLLNIDEIVFVDDEKWQLTQEFIQLFWGLCDSYVFGDQTEDRFLQNMQGIFSKLNYEKEIVSVLKDHGKNGREGFASGRKETGEN